MTTNYGQAMALIGIPLPGHLVADAEVPVLTGPQAQGDLLVFPVAPPEDVDWRPVGAPGVPLVRGEAAGNTHWLHAGLGCEGVEWAPGPGADRQASPAGSDASLTIAYVRVPAGASALLIHTDEHGANGIGAGCFAVNRKRQWEPAADLARYLED